MSQTILMNISVSRINKNRLIICNCTVIFIIESNLIDFVDPNEYSFDSADLAGCFNKCVANSSCLAFSWHKFNKICTFKTTKAVSRTCELNSFCSSILGTLIVKIINLIIYFSYVLKIKTIVLRSKSKVIT